MENTKELNIKNSFDDMIIIKNFNPELLKLKKRHTKTLAFIILDISQ